MIIQNFEFFGTHMQNLLDFHEFFIEENFKPFSLMISNLFKITIWGFLVMERAKFLQAALEAKNTKARELEQII